MLRSLSTGCRPRILSRDATPAESALNDELAAPNSSSDADRTNLITCDDADERFCNEASLITNELDINVDDLLSDFRKNC
jgi:hypothetical protein